MKRLLSLTGVLSVLCLMFLVTGMGLAYAPEFPGRDGGETVTQTPVTTYALLIVAPREFELPLAPLIAHKNATSIATTLKTLESIYEDARFSGADEPERIKRAIAYYKEHYNIQYVMLVGDVDRLPVRWVTFRRMHHSEQVEYYFPSDLYYADLYDSGGAFDTWNYDGDDYFGEHMISSQCATDPYSVNLDRVDLHPDVAVGRIPASTIAEMEGYIAKVIKYEHMTFDLADDWFHNALLIAGSGRNCDAGIHFHAVQNTLGDDFTFRTYIHDSYLSGDPDHAYLPCFCTATETAAECQERTGLSADVSDLFSDALWAGTTWRNNRAVPATEFIAVGFLGWHDHTSRVRNYVLDVDNTDRFTIAFSDGCSDGGFAGGPPGNMARFAPVSVGGRNVGGQDLPYLTTGGDELQVVFDPDWIDHDGDGQESKFYHITACVVNGVSYSRVDDHCGGGFFPDMTLADDFEDSPDGYPVTMTRPYILNPPIPAPLQPAAYDWEFNPEEKLFAENAINGQETGWVGLVAATKGASFPANGELMKLFFMGYRFSHSSVEGRNRLGDMWRSMLMRWLDDDVFDASGAFSFAPIFSDYDVNHDDWFETYCALYGIQHTMMYALFGDPSLRVGGVAGLVDTTPPTTSDNADNNWHNESVAVALTASDGGAPPSGIRETRYQIDGGMWQAGNCFTFAAPTNHSNDGLHTISYYSIDFLENAEMTKSAQVKIDTIKPSTSVTLNGESPALLFCIPGQPCPKQSCYNDSVTVAFDATDDRSGVESTWYEMGGYVNLYTGPFSVYGGDYLDWRTLRYWSVDEAGNVESAREVEFCVSNHRAGMLRDRLRILAALKEIVAMRMRPEFAETLPIKAVQFHYAYQGQPDWVLIGTDSEIKDGWGIDWDTRKLQMNGGYIVRMTALDALPPQSAHVLQPGAVLYQEQISVTVSNVLTTSYLFDLYVFPHEVNRGEEVEYTLKFVNQTDQALKNLIVTCSIDPGLFGQVIVLDGGGLDSHGNPVWSTAQVDAGATWKAHFTATMRADLMPGTVVASQAFLTSDTIPLALSDDPSTPEVEDWTEMQIKLLAGALTGQIREQNYGGSVSATVSIAGPVSQTIVAGVTGHYTSTPLAPGVYTVSVEAGDYEYHVPAGPVSVMLDGTVENTRVDFLLNLADVVPPVSSLSLSADQIVLSQTTIITGVAYDDVPGSGVSRVEVRILRENDERYWNGVTWTVTPTWLLTAGTTAWALDCGGITWDSDRLYAIASRATDGAGNVEQALVASTTPRLQTPALIAPLDGAQANVPLFTWSNVLDSQYHIQVDDDGDFSSPQINDTYLDFNAHAGRRLTSGVYYWRVKAINREYGFPESAWSKVWSVTVVARVYLPLVLRGFSG